MSGAKFSNKHKKLSKEQLQSSSDKPEIDFNMPVGIISEDGTIIHTNYTLKNIHQELHGGFSRLLRGIQTH